jgi:hypothetical protein
VKIQPALRVPVGSLRRIQSCVVVASKPTTRMYIGWIQTSGMLDQTFVVMYGLNCPSVMAEATGMSGPRSWTNIFAGRPPGTPSAPSSTCWPARKAVSRSNMV